MSLTVYYSHAGVPCIGKLLYVTNRVLLTAGVPSVGELVIRGVECESLHHIAARSKELAMKTNNCNDGLGLLRGRIYLIDEPYYSLILKKTILILDYFNNSKLSILY